MLKGVGLTPTAGELLTTSMQLHTVAQAPHMPSSDQLLKHTTHLSASTLLSSLQIFNSCSELTDSHVTHLSDKSLTQALNS